MGQEDMMLCGLDTVFYCISCRSFFCMRTTKNHTNIYCLQKIEKDGKEADKCFEKSYFHENHEIAYTNVSNEQKFD